MGVDATPPMIDLEAARKELTPGQMAALAAERRRLDELQCEVLFNDSTTLIDNDDDRIPPSPSRNENMTTEKTVRKERASEEDELQMLTNFRSSFPSDWNFIVDTSSSSSSSSSNRPPSSSSSVSLSPTPSPDWPCSTCTFLNPGLFLQCQMCFEIKGTTENPILIEN